MKSLAPLLIVLRLVLVVVFGIAGVAKLADREGARKALLGFGFPEKLTALFAWLLPILEITVAIVLLPVATAWFGAIGALLLLVVFLVGISVNLAQGKTPNCHCFGQLHSEPVSWKIFARNLVLAAMAILIVVQGKDGVGSMTAWMKGMTTGEWINLLVSALAVVLLVPVFVVLRHIMKQQSALLEAVAAMKKIIEEDYAEPAPIEREDAIPPVEGLPVGAPAPAFTLPSLDDGQLSLDELLALGKPVLLLFVSPSCAPCKTLLPYVRIWQRDYGDFLTVALLSQGTEKDVQSKIAKYEAKHVLLQGESSLADEYQAKWTPAAVLVDRYGKIASPATYGDEEIRLLVTHTVAMAELSNQNGADVNLYRPQIKVGKSLFKVGEPAPRFVLTGLNGTEVSLDSLLGTPTLLLFWNPDCGFCKAMADDLIRWESKPTTTRLVFISSGEESAVRQEGERFRSLFLYDVDFDIAPMFGARGTPSAVLLDATGRLASSLAIGEQNILALLGIRKIALPVAQGIVNGKVSAV